MECKARTALRESATTCSKGSRGSLPGARNASSPKGCYRKRPEENRKLLGGGDGDIKVGNFRDPALGPVSHLILPTHGNHSNNNHQLPLPCSRAPCVIPYIQIN